MKGHIIKTITLVMAAVMLAGVSGCAGRTNKKSESSSKSSSSQTSFSKSSSSKSSQASYNTFVFGSGKNNSKSTSQASYDKSDVSGRWSYTYESRGENYKMSLELYNDGSAKFVSDESEERAEGTWTVSGNKVSFKEKNTGTVSEFTYENGTMTMGMGNQTLVLKKDDTPLEDEVSKEETSFEKHENNAEVSFEFDGHTDAQYAGDWKVNFSKDELSLSDEENAALQVMYDDVVITLNEDGTVKTVFMSEEMEGKWESSGNSVNIVLDGEVERFSYNDGVLTGTTEKRLTLVKTSN